MVNGEFQLDLATAILRMEQAASEPAMMEFLVDRMATCDAPRLRAYLTPETLAEMEKEKKQ